MTKQWCKQEVDVSVGVSASVPAIVGHLSQSRGRKKGAGRSLILIPG